MEESEAKFKKELESKKIINLGLLSALILGSIFLISFYTARKINPKNDSGIVKKETNNPFIGTTIEGRGAIVWDIVNQEVLFEKNSNLSMPLASIAKVVMALTAIDLVPQSTIIQINKEFLNEEGDSGLFVDEKWKLKDLIDFSLITSSNDAATAIASITGLNINEADNLEIGRNEFIGRMNEIVSKMGLSQTNFKKESGLDTADGLSGANSSAKDVAMLFEYVLKNHPEILEATKYGNVNIRSLNEITHNAKNTNITIDKTAGIVASKTGFTEKSGGNLAIIIDPAIGRPVVIVVLGSSFDGRFSDVEILSKKTLEYLLQS